MLATREGIDDVPWYFAWADMNDDGSQDIVCSNGNTHATVIMILDTLLNAIDSISISGGYALYAICDVDSDGSKEILIANVNSSTIVCLNNHLVEKWRWADSLGNPLRNIIITGPNDDGEVRIVVLTEDRIVVLGESICFHQFTSYPESVCSNVPFEVCVDICERHIFLAVLHLTQLKGKRFYRGIPA